MVHQRLGLLLLLPDHPGTAVDLQQHREAALAWGRGLVDIQQVVFVCVVIVDVVVVDYFGVWEFEWV